MGGCTSKDPTDAATNLGPTQANGNHRGYNERDRAMNDRDRGQQDRDRGHNDRADGRVGPPGRELRRQGSRDVAHTPTSTGSRLQNSRAAQGTNDTARYGASDRRGNHPEPSRARGDSKATRRRIDFPDFSEREKDAVDRIMANSPHLYMAKINFEDLKLMKVIGTGSFGEVIKGEYCGTPVVIKRMLRNKIDEANMAMFAEEIQLMMGLRHPNIVQFIGASWNSYSNICFISEFLDRGDLFTVLRDTSVKLAWADPMIRMAIDSCRGMAYLHSMNPPVIHRDLKSMNILVNSNFGCKISDFGLSRTKSVDETMSVTGTPLWLPPEMIRGERYTERVDVYSFGIVLTEMDTRKIPYWDVKAKGARKKKVSGSTLMHMVAYEGLRPSVSPNCLKSLKVLIDRCVADNYKERPTFEEIIQEFDRTIRAEANERAAEEAARAMENRLNKAQMEKDDLAAARELGLKLPSLENPQYS